jgi:signal transduction histidine kinase
LAIKEILHNSLKHSKATQIDFNLIYNETSLIITIADNGVGLPEQLKYGNGLINLQKRLLAINGKIDYKNETQGLSTRLELPLTY